MESIFNSEDLTRRMHLLCDQALKGNWAALHRATGIPHATLHGYKEGKEPNLDSLTRIANACGSSIEWLITGEGTALKQTAKVDSVDRSSIVITGVDLETEYPGTYALIPRYDVSASAGYGAFVDGENIIDRIPFRLDWIKKKGLQMEYLTLIDVDGDSMQPTLQAGDAILVDIRIGTSMAANDIYVIRVGDVLLVKRLQRMISGSVMVVSDNQLYKSETIPPDELHQLNVVGKVVWTGKWT